MQQIAQIYFNDFGVAFYWKKEEEILEDRIQLVFKETGFYLSKVELDCFLDLIDTTFEKNKCTSCGMKNKCHKFLLKTPCENIDLAVSKKELMQIKDLVQGTVFQIQLDHYLREICKN